MSRSVLFRPEASADLVEAFSWYESQRAGLGKELELAVQSALGLLRHAPETGPVVHRRVRRLLLRRFPYAMYYSLEAELVEVTAIMHTSRHPRRWRRRS